MQACAEGVLVAGLCLTKRSRQAASCWTLHRRRVIGMVSAGGDRVFLFQRTSDGDNIVGVVAKKSGQVKIIVRLKERIRAWKIRSYVAGS